MATGSQPSCWIVVNLDTFSLFVRLRTGTRIMSGKFVVGLLYSGALPANQIQSFDQAPLSNVGAGQGEISALQICA